MSLPRYSIVEPHPSVSSNQHYITTGRGGAGNAIRSPEALTRGSDASGPASRASATSITAPRRTGFISGRGGAGNHVIEAPRMFSFDEELNHQMQQAKHIAPVYHVGRGGAGNLHRSIESVSAKLERRESSFSSSSSSSAESGADIATRNIKKGLKKLTGVF